MGEGNEGVDKLSPLDDQPEGIDLDGDGTVDVTNDELVLEEIDEPADASAPEDRPVASVEEGDVEVIDEPPLPTIEPEADAGDITDEIDES